MKHIDTFLKHLADNHYAAKTILMYDRVLNSCNDYFSKIGITDDNDILESNIISFIDYLNYINSNEKKLFKYLSILNKYFIYLEREKLIFLSPMIHIELPKDIKLQRKIIDKEKLDEIFSKLDINDIFCIRVRMVIELMYSSALRCMEVINLRINNINFADKEIFIQKSKYNKDRIVPVNDIALFWINKYIEEVRNKCLKNRNNPYLIFPITGKNEKLSERGFYNTITMTLKKHNFPLIQPAAIRPTSATNMLLNGMPILYIQKLLGHNNLSSTQIYLRVQLKNLSKEIDSKHPRYKIENKKEDLIYENK